MTSQITIILSQKTIIMDTGDRRKPDDPKHVKDKKAPQKARPIYIPLPKIVEFKQFLKIYYEIEEEKKGGVLLDI